MTPKGRAGENFTCTGAAPSFSPMSQISVALSAEVELRFRKEDEVDDNGDEPAGSDRDGGKDEDDGVGGGNEGGGGGAEEDDDDALADLSAAVGNARESEVGRSSFKVCTQPPSWSQASQ